MWHEEGYEAKFCRHVFGKSEFWSRFRHKR